MVILGIASLSMAACTTDGEPPTGASTFRVDITRVNGGALPTAQAPLPANLGDSEEEWEFTIEARSSSGMLEPFNGVVRLTAEPGAVNSVQAAGSTGRNVLLVGGKATGTTRVTAVYGPARLWVEDIGYQPADPLAQPRCSNGLNDDSGDVLIDFPADPGCAFADDDTEEEGTYAAGVSLPVQYALPRVTDIQGSGSTTPYPFEGVEVNTADPQRVIVTRVASDGFYVTDIAPDQVAGGYNSLFAFNFSTPARMRVCDRVMYLAGTVSEFFGFTELSFPSYQLEFAFEGDDCPVPEPLLLDGPTITDVLAMEKAESGLARVEGYSIATNFGPLPAFNNVFGPNQSNCDLNGDGQVDFESPAEGSCGNVCSDDPDCSEWTGFSARGNYKVRKGGSVIQINTGTAALFDPQAHKGQELRAVTGTLRNFSGGSLNWTIETRCQDDLACAYPGCVPPPVSSKQACVRLRSLDDNDQGSN